jgi:hypothetical protein
MPPLRRILTARGGCALSDVNVPFPASLLFGQSRVVLTAHPAGNHANEESGQNVLSFAAAS